MANVIGPDVSFYQDDDATIRQIDFVKMKSATPYVIIRVGQRNWPDPDFSFNWKKSKDAGLLRGAYWFYDSRESPESQAQLYVNQFGGDFGELPMFADFEDTYGGMYHGPFYWLLFLEELKSLLPTNKVIGIYTAYYYWDDNVPDSSKSKFSQYPLWIAGYKTTTPKVPQPWTDWMFWQYTDEGDGKSYGVESSRIDLNYFNGDKSKLMEMFGVPTPAPAPNLDKKTQTHLGVTVWEIVRFGAKCIVHIIDPRLAKVQVSPGPFTTVSNAINRYGAQIGMNGGGWPNVQTPEYRTNEPWYSNGTVLQTKSKDNRGYINVARDGKVRVSENGNLGTDLYNTWGFDRILGKDGTLNPRISDKVTKDARTGSGVTADNKLVILSAEGDDRYQRGLTFPEMWEVLKEFGCTIAGNNDGGSSSAVVNLALSPSSLIVPSDGHEANVINHVLIFSDKLDTPTEEIPEIPEDTKMSKYVVVKEIKPRPGPSISGGTRPNLEVGFEFESNVNVAGTPAGTTFVQLPSGDYVPLVYNGVEYVRLVTVTEEPPTPDTGIYMHIILKKNGTWEVGN